MKSIGSMRWRFSGSGGAAKLLPVSVWAFGLVTVLAACSSEDSGYAMLPTDSTDGEGTSDGSSGVGGGTTSDGGQVPDASAIGAASTTAGIDLSTSTNASTAGTPGLGQEDLCDSIDNDGNGIVDDVDVGGDGVCDCLRIATLGIPGTWGEGDVFDAWLDSRSNNGAVDLADTVLTPEILSPYHVIVAQDVGAAHAYSPDEALALDAWVKGGGGFMTLIGFAEPDEIVNVNTLLSSFALSYGPEQILPRRGGQTVPVTEWLQHPVTQGISLIGMDTGYPVQGGSVIAVEQGFEVLTGFESELGHVLVWGDEWITYNSEWTEHPEYQVELFWLNAIKWLTAASDCQVPIPEQIK